MSLLTKILGSKDKPASTSQALAREPVVAEPFSALTEPSRSPTVTGTVRVSPETLATLFPIRNYSEEVRNAFAHNRYAESLDAGCILFRRGEPLNSIYYLLEGAVSMDLGEGNSYEVQAHTTKSRFPLCNGKVFTATALALSEIQVLAVSPNVMPQLSPESTPSMELNPESGDIPEEVRTSELFTAFCQFYKEGELQVPSLPEVAIRLREAIEQSKDIEDVVRIIQLDPAIAAKLVHVANSPLYLPISPIHTCHDAVMRLGLAATRNLVVSYSLRQIFKSTDTFINQILREEWEKSLYLSCLCWVLASENGGVNPQEAQLAGLVSDIGVVPFLQFASKMPRWSRNPEEISKILPFIRAPIGSMVLNRLNFPKSLVEIPQLAEDWLQDNGQKLSIGDIVVLSRMHSYSGTPKMLELPAINSIPACGKLRCGELTNELSLKVLHDAQDKIAESKSLFEG